ncbi:hypothetical protein [Streptomyces glaucescens]|uniref:Uncharacterized protein n=1 Tax=Streptomyces glaucescens TaxID=1907 RepID=A0A089XDC8_STRGA|nr:hypothetical protein [Streptomyces glaucescens]AIR99876.1 hypothetical protein SGLAU_19595 [Streptomyces glaucescens]
MSEPSLPGCVQRYYAAVPYAEEAVARIYARLGFRADGVTLLVGDQPARGAGATGP